MAKYKITLDIDARICVNNTLIQNETVQDFIIVNGNMDDVANVMSIQQNIFVKGRYINKLSDNIYNIFLCKDNKEHIREMGYCVTQIINRLSVDTVSCISLKQVSQRID